MSVFTQSINKSRQKIWFAERAFLKNGNESRFGLERLQAFSDLAFALTDHCYGKESIAANAFNRAGKNPKRRFIHDVKQPLIFLPTFCIKAKSMVAEGKKFLIS